jgi:hypothetical protein
VQEDGPTAGRAEPSGSLTSSLSFVNTGSGAARNWRLKVRSPGAAEFVGLEQGMPSGPGHNQHETAGGRWIAEWWGVEEGESVPPGQDHPLPTGCTARMSRPGVLTVDYLILADGFGPQEGTMTVRLPGDGQAEIGFSEDG